MAQIVGYTDVKPEVESRLKRIEGQVRGIERMVADDRYCIDILTQIIAVRAALEQVSILMFREHTKHCMADAISSGDPAEKMRELSDCVERFLRA